MPHPQVDLDSLVTACTGGVGDRKIACETVVGGEKQTEQEPDLPTEVHSDYPPESFWLSKDAELDWFDRNAFLERNESTKGNSSTNVTVIQNPNSSSQRFSSNLKSLATIFGFPKTQKTTFADPANHRRFSKPTNARLFPQRSASMAKSAVAEPSSPKVSCMGRVRSKKGIQPSSIDKPNVADQFSKSVSVRYQQKGMCQRLFGIFRSNREGKEELLEINNQKTQESSGDLIHKFLASAVDPAPAAASDPPGLGAMQRFASGRRSTASLGDES